MKLTGLWGAVLFEVGYRIPSGLDTDRGYYYWSLGLRPGGVGRGFFFIRVFRREILGRRPRVRRSR